MSLHIPHICGIHIYVESPIGKPEDGREFPNKSFERVSSQYLDIRQINFLLYREKKNQKNPADQEKTPFPDGYYEHCQPPKQRFCIRLLLPPRKHCPVKIRNARRKITLLSFIKAYTDLRCPRLSTFPEGKFSVNNQVRTRNGSFSSGSKESSC